MKSKKYRCFADRANLTYYVYLLRDPRTDEIRYVGMTSNPEKRVDRLMKSSRLSRTLKNWVIELKELSLRPILEVINSVEGFPNGIVLENKTIIHYASILGKRLLNINRYDRRLTLCRETINGKVRTFVHFNCDPDEIPSVINGF